MKNPKSPKKGLLSSMRSRLLGEEKSKSAPATSKPLGTARHGSGQEGESARAGQLKPKSQPRLVEVAEMSDDELGRALVEAMGERMKKGSFVLPQLPATHLAIMELTSKAAVEITEVVELVERDPVLSSELLKSANSVAYAGNVQIESLQHAAMRIGLRTLRSLMMTLSMRGVLLTEASLKQFADEVWSQAHSVANISKAIGSHLDIDTERAYLVGLLQDVGRIALMAMLSKEIERKRFAGVEITAATIGTIFALYHEEAGSMLAEKWRLDDELVSVIGHHHGVDSNAENPRMAAMASLAHRLDLHFAKPATEGEDEELELPELDVLGISGPKRQALLHAALEAYKAHNGVEDSAQGEVPDAE